jgi:sugar phosphate isomerase/epimerase
MARDPQDIANELYARGFFASREEALDLVEEAPDGAKLLLDTANIDREMRDPRDRAIGDDW